MQLSAGVRQKDGSIAVFATLNLEGQMFGLERRSSLLRTFQIMAAGMCEHNISNVVIQAHDESPSTATPA